MAETAVPAATAAAVPWSGSTDASAAPKKFAWNRLLPFIGPIALFIVWDIVVRAGWIKAILLPPPFATLGTLITGLAGGPLLLDFAVTVWRTVQAFLIAAVVGVPLGVLLGSNEKAYRCLLYTSPSPRDRTRSRMPSSA